MDNLRYIIKVCGMKNPLNIKELIRLKPDMIGLIFYPKSKRFVDNPLQIKQALPEKREFKLVGVFVNEHPSEIKRVNKIIQFDFVQLHGNETVEDIEELKESGIRTIKAIGISSVKDFKQTKEYEGIVDYFLFDYKSEKHGGAGKKFDWALLNNYTGETKFLLSGGISPDDKMNIDHPACIGFDLNSKFEISPGHKDIGLLENFITHVRHGKTNR